MYRSATIIVALSLLASCARSDPITASDVGTVCHSSGGDQFGLSDLLTPRPVGETYWMQVAEASQLDRGRTHDDDGPPTRQDVRLDGASAMGRSKSRSSVTMTKLAADEAASELGRGSRVVVVADDGGRTLAAASLRRDGTVVFLGECGARRYTPVFERFVGARRGGGDTRSPADILAAFAAEPALSAELARIEYPTATPPAWDGVAADRRIIDPEGPAPPPASVMAGLRPVWVRYAVPPRWKGFDGSLAIFVPGVGWNAAVPFGLEATNPGAVSYVSRTAATEVWVLGRDADVRAPLGRLATFPAGRLAAHEGVLLTSRVDADTLDDLLRQAREGAVVFTLSEHKGP